MHSPDCSITPNDWPHGYGFCWCGCGQKTRLSERDNVAKGHVKGVPFRFIFGHVRRASCRPIEDRFWEKVEIRGPDDCWPWRGYLDRMGYGLFTLDGGKRTRSHRVAWMLTNGPIPDTLDLDHLCRNPTCHNPAHLEPVTHRVNVLRGTSPCANNARKTHCKHGHAFTPENIYVHKNGGRGCKECHRRNNLKRRLAKTTSQQ